MHYDYMWKMTPNQSANMFHEVKLHQETVA